MIYNVYWVMKLKFDLKKLHTHCIDANSRQQLRNYICYIR